MAYQDIGGGYRFATHRVGASLIHPTGATVYFQPGDDTTSISETVEALDKVEHPWLRASLAHIALSEYFGG